MTNCGRLEAWVTQVRLLLPKHSNQSTYTPVTFGTIETIDCGRGASED
jgi:hypothetical protein